MSSPGSRQHIVELVIDTLTIRAYSGGIRVYLRELIARLPEHIRVTLILSRSNAAGFADCQVAGRMVIPWSTESSLLRVLTQQLILPLLLLRRRADLLFEPVDIAPLLAPVPLVTCLHSSHLNADAGYTRWPQRLYNRLFLGLSIRRARRILAISAFVADQTARLFPASRDKLRVVHHGAGLVERAPNWHVPDDEERGGDIVFIGTLHRHKRVDALLAAYAGLLETPGRWPDLRIAGLDYRGQAAAGLKRQAHALGIAPHVHWLGRVTDEALLALLRDSRLLVLPSVVEGFGLPLVEAMQSGLPVIYARRGALPEIAGAAGLGIDPDDTPAFTKALQRMLGDTALRADSIRRGLARGRAFSWPRCAQATAAVFHEATRA